MNPQEHPCLQTSRLVLRSLASTDIEAIVSMAGRFEIADTTGTLPHPYLEQHAREFIDGQAAAFATGTSVVFALTTRADARLVGTAGLKEIDPANAQAEMGFWIGVEYWRQGYATEAARAIIQHAFTTLGLNRVYAHYMVRNPASGRVLEKAGMRREGLLRQRIRKWNVFEDVVIMAILREDWDPPA